MVKEYLLVILEHNQFSQFIVKLLRSDVEKFYLECQLGREM